MKLIGVCHNNVYLLSSDIFLTLNICESKLTDMLCSRYLDAKLHSAFETEDPLLCEADSCLLR